MVKKEDFDVGISIQFAYLSISEISAPLPINETFISDINDNETDLLNNIRKASYETSDIIEYNRDVFEKLLHDNKGYKKDNLCQAFVQYNDTLLNILKNQAHWEKGEYDKKRFNKVLSPKEFDKIKSQLSEYTIPIKLWDRYVWRDKFEKLVDLLTEHEMPDGIDLGDSLPPKMSRLNAYKIIWFLQEALKIIPNNDELNFTICDNCESVFYSYDEGGASCDNCGKSYCDNCLGDFDDDKGVCGKCSRKKKRS